MSLLAFTGVTYRYPDAERPALDAVSLTVEPGEVVLLAGASGSGKSTLLRAAAGLVPHFHGGEFAGALEVGGLAIRDHGPAAFADVAGTLLQDPETQVVMGTVRAELAFPLQNRGWEAAAVARGVEEAALALGIGALLDRPTHALSGGELQRVALGAALASRPRLLLLDEPTSQLDPVAGDELLGVLRRLNEEWGTAIVIAEHRVERVLPIADRVVELAGGRIVADAAPGPWLERTAATPLARLWALADLGAPPLTVKAARVALAADDRVRDPHPGGGAPASARTRGGGGRGGARARWARRSSDDAAALALEHVWVEPRDAAPILRDVGVRIAPGERIALMGANGAGKSTLLRVCAGLLEPTRGRRRGEPAALLTQHPGDHLSYSGDAGERHPRDRSGGERQRAALELLLATATPVLALDEPTRGTEPARRDALAARLRARDGAVVVATHDPEFAAAFADRVLLLGGGTLLADGPPADLLAGGWYFATQVARALGGAGRALTPEQGAALLATPRELAR